MVSLLVSHHHEWERTSITRGGVGNVADINAMQVEGSSTSRGQVPMDVRTFLVAVALNGECRETATAIAHIEGGQTADGIALVFQNLHGGIPSIDGLNTGNLRTAVGLWLVLRERPAIEVGRNHNEILVFVHV